MVMDTMRPVGDKWGWLNPHTSYVAVAISIAISIALSLAVYFWIERPLLRAIRDRVRRRKERFAPASSAMR